MKKIFLTIILLVFVGCASSIPTAFELREEAMSRYGQMPSGLKIKDAIYAFGQPEEIEEIENIIQYRWINEEYHSIKYDDQNYSCNIIISVNEDNDVINFDIIFNDLSINAENVN